VTAIRSASEGGCQFIEKVRTKTHLYDFGVNQMDLCSPFASFAFLRRVSLSCFERVPRMASYGIEFDDKIKSFRCLHCGEESMTVWGWVSKDNAAHAAYFVNLMTGHQETSARLTISLGGWGEEDNLAKRNWVFIEARPIAGSYELMVREP
jgi:hypothetical protein